ncbi:MAG TPA: winged helix-turn-helix domain-containing protein [Mycobacterium sp.]|nr:winged helix-turn-helix domain-containing protein [Mycobacterium sp.]
MEADAWPEPIVRVGLTATQPVRVLVDPMATVLTSVLELLGPLRGRAPAALSRRAQELARPLPITPILDELHDPFVGGVPDFLGVPSTDCDLSFADVVDRLRSMPERDIVDDVTEHGRAPGVRLDRYGDWLEQPRKMAERFCVALEIYWREVLCKVYPDPMVRLTREVRRLDTMTSAWGAAATIASTSLGVSLRNLELVRPVGAFTPRWMAGRREKAAGLVIRPMVASRLTTYDNLSHIGSVATISFATPALASSVEHSETGRKDPLPGLIGATRSRLLRALERRPATTTDIAEFLDVAPSTASHHLKALTEVEVLCRIAINGHVLYHVTDRGRALLHL